jgi:hypothetical protein
MNALNALNSNEFMNIVMSEAIAKVAKLNNQSIELTEIAFMSGNENVVRLVAELVTLTAIALTK